ncbi:hypothetical protein [Heyndrickxia camelliae]|uniref:Uncharacterized protein n=1 Tax=Heyndrickxia camelliae TaxID=1707093 RepID=A0A2N3LH24_9BACI|nr:hypothetical protein [Heyndrickxia camelliae]PKR83865.1 hypothetical protein CWO92_16530 [Heyndrickxia camelliae]
MKIILSMIVMLIFPVMITVVLDRLLGYSLHSALLNPVHSFFVMEPVEKLLLLLLFLILVFSMILDFRKKRKQKG